MTKVDFSMNSNLQIIVKNAFSETKIEEISIPASVIKICENAFSNLNLNCLRMHFLIVYEKNEWLVFQAI